MSGKVISRHMLTCDGDCGATIGENGEYPTAVDSRTAAARLGWTLVPKTKANGKPTSIPDKLNRAGQYVHDVCPACLPTFTPERLKTTNGGGSYIRHLQEDNQRMREELQRRGIRL